MKNKKNLIQFLFVCFLTTIFSGKISAQSSELGSFSLMNTTTNSATKFTSDSLSKMNKLELTKIYLQQVQSLNNILPYASFNIKGQASGVKQIDIPNSKYTSNKRDKVSDKTQNFNQTVNDNLNEIIPYSDKAEIIKGIMFVQEMIQRIDQGL